jgi:predicted lipid carrier protein YhbT/chorismate mutase
MALDPDQCIGISLRPTITGMDPYPNPAAVPAPGLALARLLIDRLDAGIVALAAARRRAVAFAAASKPRPLVRDPGRERRVHAHARAVALDLALPVATADALASVLIGDACVQQGLADSPSARLPEEPAMATLDALLARLPPPHRLAHCLPRQPPAISLRLFEAAMRAALAAPLAAGDFDFLAGRSIGIEASDIGWRWSISNHEGRLVVVDTPPEAAVCGDLVDLMLLAARVEDADALFFRRRLRLTGDTELGLLARNTLDRLDFERIPLGLRIPLNRAARLAARARSAWQARQAIARPVLPGPPVQ